MPGIRRGGSDKGGTMRPQPRTATGRTSAVMSGAQAERKSQPAGRARGEASGCD